MTIQLRTFELYPVTLAEGNEYQVIALECEGDECTILKCTEEETQIECHGRLTYKSENQLAIATDDAEILIKSEHEEELMKRVPLNFDCKFEGVESAVFMAQHMLTISAKSGVTAVNLRVRDISRCKNSIFVGIHELNFGMETNATDLYCMLLADVELRRIDAELELATLSKSGSESNEQLDRSAINEKGSHIEEIISLRVAGSPETMREFLQSQNSAINGSQDVGVMTAKRQRSDNETIGRKRKSHRRHRKHEKGESRRKVPVANPLVLNQEYVVRDIQGNELEFDLYHKSASDPIILAQHAGCERHCSVIRSIRPSEWQFCSLGEVTLDFVCDDRTLILNFPRAAGAEVAAAFADWRRRSRIRSVE